MGSSSASSTSIGTRPLGWRRRRNNSLNSTPFPRCRADESRLLYHSPGPLNMFAIAFSTLTKRLTASIVRSSFRSRDDQVAACLRRLEDVPVHPHVAGRLIGVIGPEMVDGRAR